MHTVSPGDKKRIKELNQMAIDLKHGADFSITRLTSIKTLCAHPDIASQFCFHLATCTYNKVMQMDDPAHITHNDWLEHMQLMKDAITDLYDYLQQSPANRRNLYERFGELSRVNSEYEKSEWGPIRVINNRYVLIVENAFQCVLKPKEAGYWAYRTARDYAERYDPEYGSGLIPQSAPRVKDIVHFWCNFYSLDCSEG